MIYDILLLYYMISNLRQSASWLQCRPSPPRLSSWLPALPVVAAEVAELFSDLSSELFSDLSSELFSPDEVAEAVEAAGQEGEAGQALSLPGLAGQSSSRSLKLQRVSEQCTE